MGTSINGDILGNRINGDISGNRINGDISGNRINGDILGKRAAIDKVSPFIRQPQINRALSLIKLMNINGDILGKRTAIDKVSPFIRHAQNNRALSLIKLIKNVDLPPRQGSPGKTGICPNLFRLTVDLFMDYKWSHPNEAR
jgi:hypothetical protein